MYEATFSKLGGGRLAPSPMCRWGSLANRRQGYFRAFCSGPTDSAHMRPAGSSLTMLF